MPEFTSNDQMAALDQSDSGKSFLKLTDDHKMEKEELHKKITQLENKLKEKEEDIGALTSIILKEKKSNIELQEECRKLIKIRAVEDLNDEKTKVVKEKLGHKFCNLVTTVVIVVTKNVLLVIVLVGLVQMVRKLTYNTDREGFTVSTGAEFERRIADVEGFLKKTTKLLQVQVEAIDKKLEKELSDVRKDLKKETDVKNKKLVEEIDKFDASIEGLERELKSEEWLRKEAINTFTKEYRKKNGGIGDVGLDEVRKVAREVVEKELERFAADGLGRVDYAVASGGAVVVRHSEEYGVGSLRKVQNGVHDDSVKMISPSFGEPGQCFPLKGSSGFVQIKLRTPIVPEAVTLEHVAKSVAFDRSSAPKNCQIFGWLHKRDIINQGVDTKKMILLTEFTYDLEKSNAQTFEVLDTPIVVDTISLNFTSNHRNPAFTCIYRLRVHGREA